MSRPITTERLTRALQIAARIVTAPGGEVYVAIFERLEQELAQRARASDAVSRARIVLENEAVARG